MVFADGVDAELGTLTGAATSGYPATITPGVGSL